MAYMGDIQDAERRARVKIIKCDIGAEGEEAWGTSPQQLVANRTGDYP